MNTKEAIEFMEKEINYVTYPAFERHKEKRGVIEVLKRGEKFEAMFNEIRKDYYQITLAENNAIISIGKKMDDIEQRYFTKRE